jgi:hypothetical protein
MTECLFHHTSGKAPGESSFLLDKDSRENTAPPHPALSPKIGGEVYPADLWRVNPPLEAPKATGGQGEGEPL